MNYREAGATWRPLWITLVLALAVLVAVILPGPDHVLAWLAVIPLVAGRTDGVLLLVPTGDPESLRRALLARLDQ